MTGTILFFLGVWVGLVVSAIVRIIAKDRNGRK